MIGWKARTSDEDFMFLSPYPLKSEIRVSSATSLYHYIEIRGMFIDFELPTFFTAFQSDRLWLTKIPYKGSRTVEIKPERMNLTGVRLK
jgi:hypothetical protein